MVNADQKNMQNCILEELILSKKKIIFLYSMD